MAAQSKRGLEGENRGRGGRLPGRTSAAAGAAVSADRPERLEL
jgi:hypothetical protein